MSALEDLGHDVQEALADTTGEQEARLRRGRERFLLQAAMPSSSSRAPYGRAMLGAAIVLLGLGLAWWIRPSPKSPITCQSAQGEAVLPGAWFDTAEGRQDRLFFSDASEIELPSNTRAVLTTMDTKTVRMRLEKCSVRAKITPKGPRTWRFEGGPFQVIVLGTELAIDWDPEARQMAVEVFHGRVALEGPNVRGGRIEISAGERIEVESRGADRIQRTSRTEDPPHNPPRRGPSERPLGSGNAWPRRANTNGRSMQPRRSRWHACIEGFQPRT